MNPIPFRTLRPESHYGIGFGENLIEVFATDTAGNTSAADTFTIFL